MNEIRLVTVDGIFAIRPINKRESILYKVDYQKEILGFNVHKQLHQFNPIKLPLKF